MRLDSDRLARLRDELQNRGARPSVPPPGGHVHGTPATSLELLAVMHRVAPICEVLYLLMIADHARDVREHEVLRGAVRALTDGVLSSAVVEDMLARFEASLRTQGRANRLGQVTAQLAIDRQDAEAAFMLAAVMAIADHAPDEREGTVLEELREQLGISPARARELLGEAGFEDA